MTDRFLSSKNLIVPPGLSSKPGSIWHKAKLN
nr:MAG TPA: hypothetical protein [Caudoviricetes sp.]